MIKNRITWFLLCLMVASMAGCGKKRHYHCCIERKEIHCPPRKIYYRPSPCRTGPASNVRIEGEIYTHDYLDSLYRYRHGY